MKRRKIKKANSLQTLNEKEFKKRKLQEFPIQATLDYHAYGVIDTFDVSRIFEEFVDFCLRKKIYYVCVVCGTGKMVRPVLKNILKKHKMVENFRDGGYYTGGKGSFLVKLK